jgi:hypothetical protein
MKKLCVILGLLILVCSLSSCYNTNYDVSVNSDGFVVVNGIETNIAADQEDVIGVDDDGYVVVNGVKTEYKVAAEESVECQHDYEQIDIKESTCVDKGYDLYQCKECGDLNLEEKEIKAEHSFDTNFNCKDRACNVEGCDYVATATGTHNYSNEYVCRSCGDKNRCTLEILGEDFSEALMRQATLNAGTMTGNFEIVVLGREQTLQNIDMYIFSPNMDKDKVVSGLFVKFDVTYGGDDVLFTIYYNFGLQFSEEVPSDVAVSYEGSGEIWFLETVEGNKTILFEYSII